jgi:hypothetical protein
VGGTWKKHIDRAKLDMDELKIELGVQESGVNEFKIKVAAMKNEVEKENRLVLLTEDMEKSRRGTFQKELSALNTKIKSAKEHLARGKSQEVQNTLRQFQVQKFAVTKTMQSGDDDLNAVLSNRRASKMVLESELEMQMPLISMRKELIAAISRDLNLYQTTQEADKNLMNVTNQLCDAFIATSNNQHSVMLDEANAFSKAIDIIQSNAVSSDMQSAAESFIQLSAEQESSSASMNALVERVKADVEKRTLDSTWCMMERVNVQTSVGAKKKQIAMMSTQLEELEDAVDARMRLVEATDEQVKTLKQQSEHFQLLSKQESEWRSRLDKMNSNTLKGLEKTAKFLEYNQGEAAQVKGVNDLKPLVTAHLAPPVADFTQLVSAFQGSIDARIGAKDQMSISTNDLKGRLEEQRRDESSARQELATLQEYAAKVESECGLEAIHAEDDLQKGLQQVENEEMNADLLAATPAPLEKPVAVHSASSGQPQLSPLEEAARALGVST